MTMPAPWWLEHEPSPLAHIGDPVDYTFPPGPRCLCGHFDSCEVCLPKPPSAVDVAMAKLMATRDWKRSIPVAPADLRGKVGR
jgi:hypothetical protein